MGFNDPAARGTFVEWFRMLLKEFELSGYDDPHEINRQRKLASSEFALSAEKIRS
jgi:hypothetical protein